MLAPLPVIVHVPDDTDALPTCPVLPMSRLAQPVGSADCARTTLALTANAHTNPTADTAPPRNCLVVKMPLPVIWSRASPQRASRPCWPTGRVAFPTSQL